MSAPSVDVWSVVTAIATAVYTLATIALVIVTIVNVGLVRRYTEMTARTVSEMEATRRAQVEAVDEMRRAREAESRPVLVPYVRATDLFVGQVKWGVKNVGRGPALRIDIRLGHGARRDWQLQAAALMPGEVRFVRRRGDFVDDSVSYADLQEQPLLLDGVYFDVAGAEVRAEGQTPFADGWSSLAHENIRAIVDRDLGPDVASPPPSGAT